jgi:hypothetical protein
MAYVSFGPVQVPGVDPNTAVAVFDSSGTTAVAVKRDPLDSRSTPTVTAGPNGEVAFYAPAAGSYTLKSGTVSVVVTVDGSAPAPVVATAAGDVLLVQCTATIPGSPPAAWTVPTSAPNYSGRDGGSLRPTPGAGLPVFTVDRAGTYSLHLTGELVGNTTAGLLQATAGVVEDSTGRRLVVSTSSSGGDGITTKLSEGDSLTLGAVVGYGTAGGRVAVELRGERLS